MLSLTILFSGSMAFLPSMEVDAAMSSWQSIPGDSDCLVRVWTDSTNYYEGSTTVDWYAEQNGKCGQLDYSAELVDHNHGAQREGPLTGYFSYRTPTKSFYIGDWYGANASVFLDLYKNGQFVGVVESEYLTIY